MWQANLQQWWAFARPVLLAATVGAVGTDRWRVGHQEVARATCRVVRIGGLAGRWAWLEVVRTVARATGTATGATNGGIHHAVDEAIALATTVALAAARVAATATAASTPAVAFGITTTAAVLRAIVVASTLGASWWATRGATHHGPRGDLGLCHVARCARSARGRATRFHRLTANAR